jgi:hypothetical protein
VVHAACAETRGGSVPAGFVELDGVRRTAAWTDVNGRRLELINADHANERELLRSGMEVVAGPQILTSIVLKT